jgi:hypothetical protein
MDPMGVTNALGLRLAVAAGERNVDNARRLARITERDSAPPQEGWRP